MDRDKLSMEQLGRISVEEYKRKEKTPIVLVLDNIRSMSNIGSIFRSADAFCLEKIYLCGITATPPHREINKTALGATDSVDWQYMESTYECVKTLKSKGYTIYSLEQTKNSIMLNDFKVSSIPMAIVVGNEVEGVEQQVIDFCDDVIEIPQFGTKHSLNVSVSCAVVVWEIVKQLKFQ